MSAKAPVGGKRPFRMVAGISKLSDLADGGAALGGVVAAGGLWYYCDPTNGSTTGDALSPETANSNLKTVFDLTRDGYNDGVFFIGGATAYNPAAAFDWNHNYTHLIGLSTDLPGNGQRCRVVALAGANLDQCMTFSGDGCLIANIQFNNEHATGAAVGGAVSEGDRCMFVNCFFMNPVSVYAGSWALKVTGDEGAFVRCSIGQTQSRVRNAATYGLWMATSANGNKFIECEFKSWSDTTTHDPVFIDAITSEGWSVQFENCLWQNLGNASCAVAVDDDATNGYHQVIFRGKDTMMVKMTAASSELDHTFFYDLHYDHATSGLMAIAVIET
jgi:hypothetical protein